MILSFRTDRLGQTAQTQIRLRSSLIKVYTVCNLFDALHYCKATLFKFLGDNHKFFWSPNFLDFYGIILIQVQFKNSNNNNKASD